MFYNPHIQRRDTRTHMHAIWTRLHVCSCCSSCIRSPVTSVVVKADLKRIATGNSVKRTEIARAGATIKPVVDSRMHLQNPNWTQEFFKTKNPLDSLLVARQPRNIDKKKIIIWNIAGERQTLIYIYVTICRIIMWLNIFLLILF